MSTDGTDSAQRDRALTFPVRLRCASPAEILAGDAWEDAGCAALSRAFAAARRSLPSAEVVGGGVVLHPPEVTGADLLPHQAAALRALLERAVRRAAQQQRLPIAAVAEPPPARKPARGGGVPVEAAKQDDGGAAYRVRRKVTFRLTVRRFFEIRKRFGRGGATDPADPMELYFAQLDETVTAVAWLVEVRRRYEFPLLSRDVTAAYGATRKPGEYVWSISGWGQLRKAFAEADKGGKLAASVPDFSRSGFAEEGPGGTGLIMLPGGWAITVAIVLPTMTLGDVAELKPERTVEVPIAETGPLITQRDFADATGADWAATVRALPDYRIPVVVTPFTVKRQVHERALTALLKAYRRSPLGLVVPVSDRVAEELGPTLGPFVAALADPAAPAAARTGPVNGSWPPRSTGVHLGPALPADLRTRVLRQANAAFIDAQATEVQRILRLENGFWSADRKEAFRAYIIGWDRGRRDPALFVLVLDELRDRGSLDAFFAAVGEMWSTDTYLKRLVVRLLVGSSYAGDPRLGAVVASIEALVHSGERGKYDVDKQEIWLLGDSDKIVRAAGDSADDAAGVVAVVDPYYSETSRVHQPKPEILEKLKEPTRKKVSELIGRMVCNPGERMTREQLLQKAMQEAAKEMPPLEEKDLVKVTLRRTVRVLRLERRTEGGVPEVYVHYQPVQKIGDNPWVPAGDVIIGSPTAFEAYLTYYHVEHLQEALTVFLLAETVILGGVLIIELGIATGLQLFFFVSMQLVIYRFTTDAEDRTLQGYLTAALKGELDAVGFKGLSLAVKQVVGFGAGFLVTRELVSEVATKWIVYAFRGGLTAVGIGAMEVTYQFADDLLHYSHCSGWSSPGTYWTRFKHGFVAGLVMEFAVIPLLSPALRPALEKASTALEAAKALRGSGLSYGETLAALLKGSREVEAAIARTVEHDAGTVIAKGFRAKLTEMLDAVGREYRSRAYQSLLELYGPELTGAAAEGLERLLRTAGERQIDGLLQRLLATKAAPGELLRAIGAADDALVKALSEAGTLTQLGSAPRVLFFLTQDPAVAARILGGPFRHAPAAMERFLQRLEPLSADAGRSVIRALAADNPLPAELLLNAARQGELDEAALLRLRQVHEAELQRAAAAASKKAPPVEKPVEKPADEPAEPPAAPINIETATLEELLAELEKKGFTRADLRLFRGKKTKLSAPLVRRVAELLERFTPAEVRELGEFLSRHQVRLNARTVEQLEEVTSGELGDMIGRMERVQAGKAPNRDVWSEADLAERADVTIHPGNPPPLAQFVETPGSVALRGSMLRAGHEHPPPGYHAHHIIPEREFGPGLDWMRERLRSAGSGINEAENGVFLAGSRATANPELTRLHNSYLHAGPQAEYAYTLTRRLGDLHGPEFLAEVRRIAQEMAEGEFRTLEIPRGWKGKWEPGMSAPADPKVNPEWLEE
ncbi:AHH domain-containing protein [Nucisporomicrobium flavum]|uniref:AHH domain-containing protein n=1 Tax=Nucisporomicrobium flavum TaxID=2785915 RepID=UPI0018F4F7FE|nr:AHH domain-containing protein [Nucisporomicrobium flavum]